MLFSWHAFSFVKIKRRKLLKLRNKILIESTLTTLLVLILGFTSFAYADHDERKICFEDCPSYARDGYVTLDIDDNIIYINDETQIIRGMVTVNDWTPTDGDFHIIIRHLSTGNVKMDSKLILRQSGDHHISPIALTIDGVHGDIGEYKVFLNSEHRMYESYSFFILQEGMVIEEESPEPKVPLWVKEIAGWYAEDIISEDEFLSAIEYLIKNNIINT